MQAAVADAHDTQTEATAAMAKIEHAVTTSAGAAAPQALTALKGKAEKSSYIEGSGSFFHSEGGQAEIYGLNHQGQFSSVKFSNPDQAESKFRLFEKCNQFPPETKALPTSYQTGPGQLTGQAPVSRVLPQPVSAAAEPHKVEQLVSLPAPPSMGGGAAAEAPQMDAGQNAGNGGIGE